MGSPSAVAPLTVAMTFAPSSKTASGLGGYRQQNGFVPLWNCVDLMLIQSV